MKKFLLFLIAIFLLSGSIAFAQDLKIDYQVNASKPDKANYFSFTGPIRYMAAEKDTVDARSGASVKKSTEFFQPYRVDVKGKNVIPDGLRGLFLFAVNPKTQIDTDNLNVTKDSSGVITIQYSHRGTAYELKTDRNGVMSFPDGEFRKRAIGYIQGAGPQVISSDFSVNGTASKIDWKKVWNPSVQGGKTVKEGVNKKTGNITTDKAADDSMFYWKGNLKVTFDKNILKIFGGLDAVAR